MSTPKTINSQDILEWVHEKQLASLLQDAKTQIDQEQLAVEIETETDRLMDETCQKLQTLTLDDEVQREIGHLLYKLPDLRKLRNVYLVHMARSAIELLLASTQPPADASTPSLPPKLKHRNLTIARRIRRRIRYEIFVNNSQSTMLILGLAGFISIFAIAPFLIYLIIQGTSPSLQVTSSSGQISLQPSRNMRLQLPGGKEQMLDANAGYTLVPQVSSKAGQPPTPEPTPRADASTPRSDTPTPEPEVAPTPVPDAASTEDLAAPPPAALLPLETAPAQLSQQVPEEQVGEEAGQESDRPSQPTPSEPTREPAGQTSEARDINVVAVDEGTLRNTGTFFENVGIRLSLLLIVVMGGALGSSISVIVRAQNMVYGQRPEPLVLFFTGLLKPIIGIAFAIFIFAALESGLVSVGNREQTNRTYLYLAISFVAGFSERFVQDILMKTEQTMTPLSREDSTKPLI
ncbi:MAG: hypothetical protein EA367_11450 [Leptolyngbya sp. DLM2.Bin15]|nr:MAG: hypothetical protein EA367_11450 [Leptolyngbya sp. DLM2.Bin15]